VATLIVLAVLLMVLSILSFFVSVSKKKMSFIYTALILFGCCVVLAIFTLSKFIWGHATVSW
jgi:hypothetical protein